MTSLDLVLLAGKKKIIQVNGPNLELKFCMSTQEMIEYLCSLPYYQANQHLVGPTSWQSRKTRPIMDDVPK